MNFNIATLKSGKKLTLPENVGKSYVRFHSPHSGSNIMFERVEQVFLETADNPEMVLQWSPTSSEFLRGDWQIVE
jgi:hypothetical protein